MENKLIIANHKMNMMAVDLNDYIQAINEVGSDSIVICPTSIYIPYFLKKKYEVGLQNSFYEQKGAYTGEISPLQAKKLGVNYTIIGHSERREHFKEEDNNINKKISAALDCELKVILCIGETLEQRNMLKTDKILKRQIIDDLKGIDKINDVIIAYEPIWAIGTGVVPTNKEISATISYIKTIIDNLYPDNNVKIVYGGSVTEKNIEELNQIKELNGFLVGGASLDTKKFLKIIEVVVNQ